MRKRELRDFTMHDKGEPSAAPRTGGAGTRRRSTPREPQHPPDGGSATSSRPGPIVPVSSSGLVERRPADGSVMTRRPVAKSDPIWQTGPSCCGPGRSGHTRVRRLTPSPRARRGRVAMGRRSPTRADSPTPRRRRVEPPTNGADDGLAKTALGLRWVLVAEVLGMTSESPQARIEFLGAPARCARTLASGRPVRRRRCG